MNREQISFGAVPQNAPDSDKPGSYQLAVRVNKDEVTPGDTVDVEIYITGYGMINGAKIVFYPPPYFINSAWSKCSYGLNQRPNGDIYFGAEERPLQQEGMTIRLNGAQPPNWPESSLFFDVTYDPNEPDRTHQIMTEIRRERAPVELNLHVQENVPSGNHDLDFHLSYFNGQEWKSASQRVGLTVPNFFKRNEALTWALGIIAVVATVASPILSLLQ